MKLYDDFKFVKWIVRGLAVVLAIVCLYYLTVILRSCKHMVEEATQPFEEKQDQTWINPQTGEPTPAVKPVVKQPWFGQDDKPRLEITIPPSDDTVKLRIPGGDVVYAQGGDSLNIRVVKINPAIVKLRPSLHFCAMYDFAKVGFGVKVRMLEIWRFGLAGYYVHNMGPGAGVDLRLISNVSIDAVRFIDGFGCGVSLKL